MRREHSITFVAVLTALILGCATTQKTVEAPVSQPAPEPVVVEEVQVEPVETVPAAAPDVQALRDSISSHDTAGIQSNAESILERNAQPDESAEALRALAAVSLKEGRIAEAQMYADNAATAMPDNAETRILQARIAHADNRDDDAVKLLKTAIEIAPDNPTPYILKSAILLSFLDTERALADAQKAHEIAPKNCDAVVVYADSLMATRNFEKSIEQYEAADSFCSLSESALKNMAKLYEVHVQNAEKSCKSYQRLCEIDPENAYYKASRDYQCSAAQNPAQE
ncbi:MAG: tetratricopeptide repeat protein [Proteobacteria bacterium]|nr:tetratricopeptide repeat protein [Pseudomonadota bacterium]